MQEMKVQVFNSELGTRKYVGRAKGFVTLNGFVLAVICDENGVFRCEKLSDIIEVSESEKQDGRNDEKRSDGGLVPRGTTEQPAKPSNPGANGFFSSKTKRS